LAGVEGRCHTAARGPGSTQIELIGGRLCPFAGRRIGSYMSRVHGRLLSIYVMATDALSPTGGIRIERVEGHLIQAGWMEHGLIYSVMGELFEPGLLVPLDDMHL